MRDATDAGPGSISRYWSRRQFLIGCGVVGGATLLAACGPASAPVAGPTSPPAAPPTTAPAPPAAGPTTAPAAAKPTTAPAAQTAPTSAPTVAAKNGGAFTFAFLTENPPGLDPYLNVSYRVQEFAAFFYSRLLMSKKAPGVAANAYIMEGDLAESWKPSEDGLTWTFTLRPNATWHNLPPMNGRPVTAEDVVWSFNHFMEVSPQKSTFGQVSDATAADARTVQFRLKNGYAPFEAQIGSPIFWILPKEVVGQYGDVTTHTVGSGPFIFDKFDSGVSITGKKNPNYYRAAEPHIDDFAGLIIPDVATRMAGLRAHELDYASVPDTEKAGLMQSNPEILYSQLEYNLLPFMYWKVDQPPFNDPRVRQAVSMSLNRDNSINVLYNGRGGYDNFIPWALSEWWLDPRGPDQGPSANYFQYDPRGARQLLAAAGYPNGLQVTLISTPGYGDVFVQGVERVQQDLKSGGIDATIQMQEYAQYVSTTFAGKFTGGNTLVWGLETPFTEPHDYLFNMYHPKGTRNHAGINDDKLTAMIEKQALTLDRAQRKQVIHDIQRHIGEQMYYVPGVINYLTFGYNPRIQNLFTWTDFGFGGEVVPKLWIA